MATSVTVGGVDATDVTVTSDTELTATVPAGAAAGSVDVTVTTSGGSATLTDGYTYEDAPELPTVTALDGVTSGTVDLDIAPDQTLTVTGTGFVDGDTTIVLLDSDNAVFYESNPTVVNSPTELVATWDLSALPYPLGMPVKATSAAAGDGPWAAVEVMANQPLVATFTAVDPDTVSNNTLNSFTLTGTGLDVVQVGGSNGQTPYALDFIHPDGTRQKDIADPITAVTETEITLTDFYIFTATTGDGMFVIRDIASNQPVSNEIVVEVT